MLDLQLQFKLMHLETWKIDFTEDYNIKPEKDQNKKVAGYESTDANIH